ncbi:MAG: SDR family NAD(P)-dependent oxidoreductase [Bacteroidetes bacterium]|nr:SDR family NAD(P)-dependent oxidoreductase [Bacteroidota bacterium]
MKIALVTGSTDGIGKQTATELALLGYHVIIHGKNRRKGEITLEEIREKTGNRDLTLILSDLSSQKSIREMSGMLHKRFDHLDILINNAGTYQRKQNFSRDGYEMTFAVNHLSVYSLTLLLLDMLKKSEKGKIIIVSSIAHRNSPKIDFADIQEINSYMDYSAYALSKLSNILFTYELASKVKEMGISVNCLHPGVISTKLLYEGFGISGASVEEGAGTSVFLAHSDKINGVTGKYFTNKSITESSPFSYNPEAAKNLWNLSENLTGISLPENL